MELNQYVSCLMLTFEYSFDDGNNMRRTLRYHFCVATMIFTDYLVSWYFKSLFLTELQANIWMLTKRIEI